jgi:uncharacterized membrane protein
MKPSQKDLWRAQAAYDAETFWLAMLGLLLSPIILGILGVILMLVLGGCQDAPYVVSRHVFHLECNPQRVPGTQCVAARKGN